MSTPAFFQSFLTQERGLFAKVVGAVPQDGLEYRADPKARSARDLIEHLVGHNLDLHWEPELHRLKGVLLLSQSAKNEIEAEARFRKAIEVARNQSAKSFELRAATSLARLWQGQGKNSDARGLLVPVYEWFTEGFATADLKDAKTLLDQLS